MAEIILYKSITRQGKSIIAEVYYKHSGYHISVDYKPFHKHWGFSEPTDDTYQKANAWADELIAKHERNTK